MSCEICGKTTNLKSCGRCLKANYCGREHQLAHWKDHKHWCAKNDVDFSCTSMDSALINTTQQIMNNTDPNIENIFPLNPDNLSNLHLTAQEMTENQILDYINHQQSISPQSNNTSVNNMLPMNMAQMDNYQQMTIPMDQANNQCNNNYPCPQTCQAHLQQVNNVPIMNYAGPTITTSSTPNESILNVNSSNQSGTFINTNNISMPYTQTNNRDFMLADELNKYCQIILKDMNKYGFCVIDDFLQNGDLILNEVSLLYQRGLFQAGQVVNRKANSNSKLIRGDKIIWVEGSEQICSNIGYLVRILDSIITRCNTMALGEFFKYRITRRTKAMIACYPGNDSKYVQHVDNPNNDGRCITSIYYLNKDYNRERDGGILRLFPQMNDGIVADIEPRFNRVIFFWSDRRNPHEVMPSKRMRFAITVWYFDANERAKAIEKYKENSMQCPNDKDLVPF